MRRLATRIPTLTGRRLLAAIFVVLQCSSGASGEPKLFSATYRGDFKGLPVTAKATRELVRTRKGYYELTSDARSFLATISEQSRFRMSDETIVPEEYQYRRKGLGRNRDHTVRFDWSAGHAHQVSEDDPWSTDIETGVLDRLSYQIQLREQLAALDAALAEGDQFTYRVADGGRVREYRFELRGEELIDTTIGPLRTVRVERLRNSDRRQTTFWLAKDWDFLLVQLRQTEAGSGSFDLVLESAVIDGRHVTGLGGADSK